MANEGKLELFRAHHTAQDKYTYFLLAVAGAAIGFAVNQTHEAVLSWSKLPLAAAVVCWGLSFFFGCRQVVAAAWVLDNNYQFLSIKKDELAPQIVDEIWQRMEANASRPGRFMLRQFRFLIAGAVFYILWHVTEMYLRTFTVAGH